jgi:Ca2+-binding RTX toxin-like protein
MLVESLEARQLMSASLDPVTKVLTINGSTRNDVITVSKVGDQLKVTENGVSKLFTASKVGRIKAFGNAGVDRITVDQAVTTPAELHAGPGGGGFFPETEVLRGGGGNDTLYADGSNALIDLYGGGGNDTLYASKSEGLADGGSGNDTIYLQASYVQAFGGTGNDRFVVQRMDGSTINGGSGQDTADFSGQSVNLRIGNASALTAKGFSPYSGADTPNPSDPADYNGVHVGDDVEVLRGGRGSDRIFGGGIDNVLYGGAGSDVLNGGAGRDALFGEDGNDVLISRDGAADFLSGGFGTDFGQKDDLDTTNGVEHFLK